MTPLVAKARRAVSGRDADEEAEGDGGGADEGQAEVELGPLGGVEVGEEVGRRVALALG